MINGEGLYYKDGKPEECVWENDVKFVISSSEADRIACSIVISLLFYVCVIGSIKLMGELLLVSLSIVIFCIMSCEFCKSKTY